MITEEQRALARQLKEITECPLMECLKAVVFYEGDLEKAEAWLEKCDNKGWPGLLGLHKGTYKKSQKKEVD